MAHNPVRIQVAKCAGVLIDVQPFFLQSLASAERRRILKGTREFIALVSKMKIPLVVTLERPIKTKGQLPKELKPPAKAAQVTFEKDFFDLTKEPPIARHLRSLKRKQIVVAGCETDVCVLQSCLGLLAMGFEVFAVEDLLFSSDKSTESAIQRLRAAGVCFLTFKTLFHELVEAQEESAFRKSHEGADAN